jgi:hypothetical protein
MKKLNLKTVGAIGAAGMIALSVAGVQAAAVFAQAPAPQTPSAVVTAAEDVSTGPDTDTIDGVVDAAVTTGAEVKDSDTDNLNVEEQVGDQTGVDAPSTEAGN